MAGISNNPNSPRQKMINLMYLVFIAMMALNVSSEVLDGFGLEAGEYAVTVTQNGVPVRNLGIIPEFEGIITADPTTDEEGKCVFSIDKTEIVW